MAVGDAREKLVLTQFSFQSHLLLFSRASKVRGENVPERKFAATGCRTHNPEDRSFFFFFGGGGGVV